MVGAEICIGKIDERRDADGKNAECAKNSCDDSDEPCHAKLDVWVSCKVVFFDFKERALHLHVFRVIGRRPAALSWLNRRVGILKGCGTRADLG